MSIICKFCIFWLISENIQFDYCLISEKLAIDRVRKYKMYEYFKFKQVIDEMKVY